MIVYRLEKNGWGAFCSCSGLVVSYTKDAVYAQHGNTTDKNVYQSDYRFGCDSIDKLIEYFGSDFAMLLDKGAEIVEYNIHKAHVTFSVLGIELAFPIRKVSGRRVVNTTTKKY
jgi:hypothetical protein